LRILAAAAPLLIFTLALVALHRLAGEIHLSAIRASFSEIPVTAFALAGLLAAASYLLLTQYDRLAVRHVGSDLPYSRIAVTSFVSYAVGTSRHVCTSRRYQVRRIRPVARPHRRRADHRR
jgi:uncharacterized membrane protein YbhN (UPF0104 family)